MTGLSNGKSPSATSKERSRPAVDGTQGLLWSDVTSKIPAQQLRAFVVWMRPAVGAAAALAAVVLLRTAIQDPSPALVLATALTAGFSERYVVGAVDRFASQGKKSSD